MATALPAPDDAVVPTERQLQVEDPSIAVRNVLIHRYAENSDSWAPLAEELMKDHTVVVPDLRGIGKSSKPEGGYDKKTQAKDMPAVVTALMVRSMNFDIKVDPQALLFSQLPDQIELKSQSVGRELYRRRTAEVQANRNCRAGFACDTL
jgi:alpha-beta hydrolase superfamily lysophospholipase